jgi:hypothetical protein
LFSLLGRQGITDRLSLILERGTLNFAIRGVNERPKGSTYQPVTAGLLVPDVRV